MKTNKYIVFRCQEESLLKSSRLLYFTKYVRRLVKLHPEIFLHFQILVWFCTHVAEFHHRLLWVLAVDVEQSWSFIFSFSYLNFPETLSLRDTKAVLSLLRQY